MTDMIRMAVVSLAVSVLFGCSSEAGVDAVAPGEDAAEIKTADAVEEIVLAPECKGVGDCDPTGDCVSKAACVEGECVYTFGDFGVVCREGCFEGFCDGDGECGALQEVECPEADGNLCTTPTCDTQTGECGETVIADGLPPYASSDCFTGAVCVGGEQDSSGATPTALALECEALTDQLEPFVCVSQYVCVGGTQGCKAVPRPDGVQCWKGEGGEGEVCPGFSCQGGQCSPDKQFEDSCLEEDFPQECDEGCLQCTRLTCHWIPDPANPDNPQKKVRYCRPGAVVGEACVQDPCFVGQVCAFGSQVNGPIGKESLGVCAGGETKTKEQCLDELGKPALDCLVAGAACDPAKGGCHLKQETADQWCWPPEWKCFDKSDTYCTHLDSGENWDPETGCHTAWVDLNCNDDNECTVDACKTTGSEWLCEHQPVEGSTCDDGNACTVGEQCQAGQCAGGAIKCVDGDDNPCNNQTCDPATGECLPPQTDGVQCDDNDACTVADACLAGSCSGPPLDCNDNNQCTSDSCHKTQGCQSESMQDGTPCKGGGPWSCQAGQCVCAPVCDGLSCGSDGCGGQCQCNDGYVCQGGLCVGDCVPHKFKVCYQTDVWYFDSCNNPEEIFDDCSDAEFCLDNLCQLPLYNGQWYITANPSQQMLGGFFPITFPPQTMTLTVNGQNAHGVIMYEGNTMDYWGTVSGKVMSLTADYSISGLNVHEAWEVTFTSPTKFQGVDVETNPLGTVYWNITGLRQ